MSTNLTQLAIEYFESNIAYIKKEHPILFTQLSEFDAALDNNYYTPRYEITIEKNSYYDVIELSSSNKLYSKNSYLYAKEVTKSISFKKDENVYKTFKEHPLDIPDMQDSTLILQYIHNNIPNTNLFGTIDKFIFFGVGLGTHIEEIDKKLDAKAYLFVEDDIELFRLSLFVTPYFKIASTSQLFFAIFQDNKEFKSTTQKFLNYNFYQNQFIKFFQMLNQSDEKVKQFHIQVVSQSQNLFFYNSILEQYSEPIQLIKKEFNFLNLLSTYEKTELFTKPVMLLAAGPSLHKNIQLVKSQQDSFVIVALSSVLNILEKYSIEPDIVTHMDGFEPGTQHFRKLKSLKFLQNSIFFFSARSPKYIINLFDKKQIFIYENGTNFKSSMGNLSAPCVGSTTYLMLLALGVQELYLIGLDLALDQETGMTHSREHEFVELLDLNSGKNDDNDIVKFKREVVSVEGNFRSSVYTTVEFELSIESISTASTAFKKKSQLVYNLNDGARFQNTIPLQVEKFQEKLFPILNKKNLKSNLLKNFMSKSSSVLDNDEKKILKKKTLHIEKLLEKLKQQQKETNINKKRFFLLLTQMFQELSQDSDKDIYDISLILQEFFKYIDNFIYDFFNTAGLENEEIHLGKINLLLCQSTESILKKYLYALASIS